MLQRYIERNDENVNRNRIIRNVSALLPLCLALFAGGCAQQPPLSSNLSGKQLIVTMTFNGPVDPSQYYFFLINAEDMKGAKGPIAVFDPPYGNGFATVNGQDPNGQPAQGFTDYVEFNVSQPLATGNYGLWHVKGALGNSTTPPQYLGPRSPISFVAPGQDPNNPASSTTLQFTIDLAQLIPDTNGQPLTLSNPQAAVQMALALHYIQINMVSTSLVPVDATTPVNKQTDALGDTRNTATWSSWIEIDLSQYRTYQNTDNINNLQEPANDVYPNSSGDAPIDLVNWSIQVVQK